MSRSPKTTTLVLMLCLAVVAMGCIGPFNMSGQVLHWNQSLSDNDWVCEGFFLLLVIIPVYELTLLADVLIFNSIEFWSGENPISPPGAVLSTASPADEG